MTGLGRRAKYGLIHTDRALTMVFHLGMSGRWRIDPEADRQARSLVIETAGHRFALYDPRRFGFVDLVPTDALEAWPPFAAMGPEPLGPDLTAGASQGRPRRAQAGGEAAAARPANCRRPRQHLRLRGALPRRIDPRKPAGQVSKPALERLVAAIREVLEEAIEAGGSSLRDYARPDGELGYFSKRFDVYGREGQPCRREDDGVIRRVVQGASEHVVLSEMQSSPIELAAALALTHDRKGWWKFALTASRGVHEYGRRRSRRDKGAHSPAG